MSTDRLPPESDALLEAIAEFLETDAMPQLAPYERFQARVAVNVLQQLRREGALYGEHAEQERTRIAGLLGAGDGALEALRPELAAAIRADRVDWQDPGLWDHLRALARERLEIANPKWLREA